MCADQLISDYCRIIIDQVPMLDVRSPGEFKAGSIPGAMNIALLTDDERHQVGLTYRQQGREVALDLALNLIDQAQKDVLVDRWSAYLARHPNGVVYCARGGMRSGTAAGWIQERSGSPVARIEGGYKAFRNYLLSCLEPDSIKSRPVLLGGRTGSGKTRLLQTLVNSIDLEAIANHRGSSFGRFTTPQPGQADFENRLAVALIRHGHRNHSHLVLEDEGRHVGKRFLPKALSTFFSSGDLVVLDISFAERVNNIYQEYVLDSQALYAGAGEGTGPGEGMWLWFEEMNKNMDRIAKRLGTSLLEQIRALLEAGCYHQEKNGDPQAHKHWIRLLLRHYYDPMYDYQLSKREKPPLLTGKEGIIRQYLISLTR